jgi:peptidoglycan/LPS O-acetylase OafA/YrhL
MSISLEETIALDLGFDTMKPNDEDVTPPPEDVEAVESVMEIEITTRKRRGRRKETKIREYGSVGSMIAWMAFLLVWLFFFAGDYGIFENIAVVLVALFIVGAVNAVTWIPIDEGGWKARTSAASGIVWIIFLIVWIIFFAGPYGIYENIGIGLASLLLIGALNVLLWVPTAGEGWGARISALGGIGWLTFLVLWLPFANDFALIYSINVYQNVAIILASFLIMLVVVIAPWSFEIGKEVHREPGLRPRLKGTMAGFILWLVFIVIWLMYFAGNPIYSANQNVAVVLLSFAIFCAVILGLWLPWARRRGEGPENWWAIGLAFIWVLALTAWFWFFADVYDPYQNFAVFLLSLVVMAAISGGAQWKKARDFRALDWDD